MKKIILILLVLALGFVLVRNQTSLKPTQPVDQPEKITITGTKPEPLDEATILPNETIIINFSKPIEISRLKVRIEPETPLLISTPNKEDLSQSMEIRFKEGLELGSGYTLSIIPDPANEVKLPLEKDYFFHIKTISYRGV